MTTKSTPGPVLALQKASAPALARQSFPALAEAHLVTDLFCAMRYGNRPLAEAQQAQVDRALAAIQAASGRTAGVLRREL